MRTAAGARQHIPVGILTAMSRIEPATISLVGWHLTIFGQTASYNKSIELSEISF